MLKVMKSELGMIAYYRGILPYYYIGILPWGLIEFLRRSHIWKRLKEYEPKDSTGNYYQLSTKLLFACDSNGVKNLG